MATARDTLLGDLAKLFKGAYSERAESGIASLLERFRIQQKTGTESKTNTAREVLQQELVRLWQAPRAIDLSGSILGVLDGYRMQIKQVSAKKISAKNSIKVVSNPLLNRRPLEPLAGGPQKRQRVRGECPKCHSMGVVLARSYNGDEYLSCIYCGYQTYRASMDLEFDLPLAAELLNRRFDDKEHKSV